MQDRTLYARLLGIEDPWRVTDVTLRLDEEQAVVVSVAMDPDAALLCPKCERRGSRYDARERRWRHLDTMQYRTILVAEVPRVQCDEHGVVQIAVPWSDPKSRFTALFEALVIDWLKEASFSAVARQLSLCWHRGAGIQARAVRRGRGRSKKQRPRRIGVDETSFRKRAEYITVVNDLDRNRVLWIGDERRKQTLSAFYAELGPRGCAGLESVAMDMWAPYISSTREHVPDADRRIVFDKFHIAQHLGRAVDEVRRAENRELVREGDGRLKKTKYLWLTNPDRMSTQRWEGFAPLRDSQLRVARAWAIKESANDALGLCSSRLGGTGMEGLVRLGDPVSSGAHQARGSVDQVLLGRRDQCSDDERDQRSERGAQLEDPVDQAEGLRLPQSEAVPQCHLLSSRRP